MALPWQIDGAIFAHFAVQLSVYATCSIIKSVSRSVGVVRSYLVAITLTWQATRPASNQVETQRRLHSTDQRQRRGDAVDRCAGGGEGDAEL